MLYYIFACFSLEQESRELPSQEYYISKIKKIIISIESIAKVTLYYLKLLKTVSLHILVTLGVSEKMSQLEDS